MITQQLLLIPARSRSCCLSASAASSSSSFLSLNVIIGSSHNNQGRTFLTNVSIPLIGQYHSTVLMSTSSIIFTDQTHNRYRGVSNLKSSGKQQQERQDSSCRRWYTSIELLTKSNIATFNNKHGTNSSSWNTIRAVQLRLFYYCTQYNQKRTLAVKKKDTDPFRVLGLHSPVTQKIKGVGGPDITVQYAAVKRNFLKIAMKHHPDTCVVSDTMNADIHREIFLTARSAFEAIVEGPNGTAILRSESEKHSTKDDDAEFTSWFQQETGHSMPYMDAATMREVADMTEQLGEGLDRDGGMWTLARMVAKSVKSGGDAKSILQLETGTVRDPKIDGIIRRRRKW